MFIQTECVINANVRIGNNSFRNSICRFNEIELEHFEPLTLSQDGSSLQLLFSRNNNSNKIHLKKRKNLIKFKFNFHLKGFKRISIKSHRSSLTFRHNYYFVDNQIETGT